MGSKHRSGKTENGARQNAFVSSSDWIGYEQAAEIAGVKPGPMFRQTPHRGLAERLRELLRAVGEPGYRGDRLVTDAWATELGLRDSYEWKRFG